MGTGIMYHVYLPFEIYIGVMVMFVLIILYNFRIALFLRRQGANLLRRQREVQERLWTIQRIRDSASPMKKFD